MVKTFFIFLAIIDLITCAYYVDNGKNKIQEEQTVLIKKSSDEFRKIIQEYLREKKDSKWRLINVILQNSKLSNSIDITKQTTIATTVTSSTRTSSSSQFRIFNCGEPSNQPFLKRIINGQQAFDNSWPWIVQLYTNSFICGGTIIGPNLIITAANCVIDLKAEDIFFIYGTNYLQNQPNRNATNAILVSEVIIHPNFNPMSFDNDIALIKTKTIIPFSDKVLPICLPNADATIIFNKSAYTSGWGLTQLGNLSTRLLQTQLDVINEVNQTLCIYNKYRFYCTLGKQSSNYPNVCSGDSGGPLMYLINGKWFLYGITSQVSFMKTCSNNLPSYFTIVSSYLKWINQTSTGQNSPSFECGLRSISRIINGKLSVENSWPWIVQIHFLMAENSSFVCTGTIISDRYVISHISCLKNFAGEILQLFIVVGQNKVGLPNEFNKIYPVQNIYQNVFSDLVIFRVLRRFEFNSQVNSICLPTSNDFRIIFDKQVSTAGWGSTNESNTLISDFLYETNLLVQNSNTYCGGLNTAYYCTVSFNNSNICNMYDYGNPLMYNLNGKWFIYGIYSNNYINPITENCLPQLPSFAQMIPLQLNWIKNQILI